MAREAFLDFGKGHHAAGLDFGDCFAYALAKITVEPKREESVSDIRGAARHRGYYVTKFGLTRKREAGWVGGDGTAHGDTAMTIELKPEHQQMIDLAIRSGIYHDSGEVLDQAFEIIRAQLHSEDWLAEQRAAVAAHIATGFAQAERGELMDGEVAMEMLHERRAARFKKR